jgi:hypothetical protein
MREKLIEEWGKLHNQESYILYFSQSVTGVINHREKHGRVMYHARVK